MKKATATFQIPTPQGVLSVSVGDLLPDDAAAVKAAPYLFKTARIKKQGKEN